MGSKKWLLTLCFLLVFSLWLSGISRAQRPIPMGTFTMAMEMDISTMDPNKAIGWTSRGVWANIFQALVVPSGLDWHSIPSLAESWETLDPLTWKFTIRKGIKFHNGQPLTSADVKFSFNRILGKINRKYPAYLRRYFQRIIADIETPDDYTVIFHTKYPEVSIVYLFGAIFIVPQHYVEKVGDDVFGKNPVGTAPYVFKERKVGESVTLEAFENYWDTNPLPGATRASRIKTVVFKIIPEMQTRIAALKAGELDCDPAISPDIAKDLEKDPNIRISYHPINRPLFLMFNWIAKKDPKTGEPNPLCDVRVRKALNYALDLDAVITNYLTGREYRTTLVGRGSIGYNPSVPFYEYNPEKAGQLLKEAGYPHGFTLTYHLPKDVRPSSQAIAQYWRDIGVDVRFKRTTTPVVMRAVLRKKFYGIVHWNSGRGTETVKGFFDTMLRPEGMYALQGPDERVVALVKKQGKEFDLKKREKLINEIIQILWKDAWYVPLWEAVSITALRKEWHYESMPTITGIFLPYISKKK